MGGKVVRESLHQKCVGSKWKMRSVLFRGPNRDEQARVTREDRAHLHRRKMLEPEGPVRRGLVRHWEVLGLVGVGALASWQVVPALGVGLLAVGAGALIPWRGSGRRVVPLAVAMICVLGGILAATTAWRVRQIEANWGSDTSGVRGQVIEGASQRLEADLAAAVSTARTLADLAMAEADRDRMDGSRVLFEAIERPGLERGVVLFSAGEPWIWVGRDRLMEGAGGSGVWAGPSGICVLL